MAAGTTNPVDSADYFRAKKVTVTEGVPTAAEIAAGYLAPTPSTLQTLSAIDLKNLDWNAMVMIGEKVIDILKAGRPVVNIQRDSVAVVPGGVADWQLLAGWQVPVTKIYNFTIQNYLGMDVVSLRLKVAAMWGGNLSGKGQYLANVNVVPEATRVLWGWNLDLWTENHAPVNAGSVDAPVAGLGFDIRYKATTLINEMDGASAYYVTGDGKINAL
jgi:hypothetical protein